MKGYNITVFLLLGILPGFSQECSLLSLAEQNSIVSTCNEPTMTSLADVLGRPYLYIATTEGGLKVYDISDVPIEVASIGTSQFETLHVNSISQQGDYLYLAIGNSFSDGQAAGLAVVDVTTPSEPTVTDYFTVPGSNDGTGMVAVSGNRAFLAAMSQGVVIIDITDVNDLQMVSQFIPDINFPEPDPDPAKVNARCIVIENNLIYLCYDAGGFRIIDFSDENNMSELGHYSNPELMGLPRAYNNLVIHEQYAFIAVDYCGMEVLDISDPSDPTLVSWWNPWDCSSNPFNWFSSAGHANEIVMDHECDLVFISTGKSDMYVLNVADPLQPDSCSIFGGVDNDMGTWGVSLRGDSIYLSYICAIIPFASNWTGVKILAYTSDCADNINEANNVGLEIFPNPAQERLYIRSQEIRGMASARITDAFGRLVFSGMMIFQENTSLDIAQLPPGIYSIDILSGESVYTSRFIKLGS